MTRERWSLPELGYCILVGCALVCLSVIILWQNAQINAALADKYTAENNLRRFLDRCESNPDGSGLCKAHTFLVPSTTTTHPTSTTKFVRAPR